MRRARLLPGFRRERIVAELETCIAAATHSRFRVLHYSVQDDHLHFIVEATDRVALSRGVQGLAIRLARGVNRVVRRCGKVWADRFHARDLRSPREVRAGIVYVLMNHKKHLAGVDRRRAGVDRGRAGVERRSSVRVGALDRFSSAAWFDGFTPRAGPIAITLRDRLPTDALPIARPRTWLARKGWRRLGLIAPNERPS